MVMSAQAQLTRPSPGPPREETPCFPSLSHSVSLCPQAILPFDTVSAPDPPPSHHLSVHSPPRCAASCQRQVGAAGAQRGHWASVG